PPPILAAIPVPGSTARQSAGGWLENGVRDPGGIPASGADDLDAGLFLVGLLFRRLAVRLVPGALLERGAQDVAQRRAGIGGAILGDRLLLLGDLERLDGNAELARLPVELGDPGVHLLADGEAFRTLFAAVAGEIGPLDEGGQIGPHDLDVD